MSIVRIHEAANPGLEDTAFYTALGTAFDDSVEAVAIQPDGKILIGGTFIQFDGNTRKCLVRLNADGTEDLVFSSNISTIDGTGIARISAIAVQPDGKIIVGGNFNEIANNLGVNNIARLNADGTEDVAFNTNTGSAFNNRVRSLALQSDGKILVGGSFTEYDGNTRNRLVRLEANGTEDTAFYTNLGSGFGPAASYVASIKIQTDGKILAAGGYQNFNANSRLYLVRLNSDGTEDTAFYTNLGSSFDSLVNVVDLDSDGNIYVGGFFLEFNSNSIPYLAKLAPDGTDISFDAGITDYITSIKIIPQGKILIGGEFTSVDSNSSEGLCALDLDGTVDLNFLTNAGLSDGFNALVLAIETTTTGKILVGGSFTTFNSNTRNRLVQLEGYQGAELLEQRTLRGLYRPSASAWELGGEVSIGDDAEVEFTMTPGGQLQYTSSNLPGNIVESKMKFLVKLL